MLRRAFRIVSPHHEAGAWTGEGARRFGGRWNSIGRPVVYAADTLSLAALERLVHLGDYELLQRHRWSWIEYDDANATTLTLTDLPPTWANDPPPPEIQQLGDAWLTRGDTLALRVPSVIVPGEFNVMLNPTHSAFATAGRGSFEDFRFDPRLRKGS